MTEDKRLESALRIIPMDLRRKILKAIEPCRDSVQEIVLRAQKPVCVYHSDEQKFVASSCVLTSQFSVDGLLYTSQKDLCDVFNIACGYSVYSHINEICEGYITIKGGHRVGICGTAVTSDGIISNIRDISTISIRIAREVIGCSEKIVKDIVNCNGGVLICGSPSSGKTTLIRDIARCLSTDYRYKVAVIDSRGEIAATTNGVSQNDLGVCDIFSGYPRSLGIEQSIRSLSPKFIICDEIGSKSDLGAIIGGINSGVRFVATIHAATKEELMKRPGIFDLIAGDAFEKIVFLFGRDRVGTVRNIYSKEVLLNA